MIDPSLELVACGSSHSSMPTFGAWEATVLEHAYDQIDYLSLHAYYEERNGDLGSFLASAVDMESLIEAVISTADHVRAKTGAKKRINLSFDEWNVWYISGFQDQPPSLDWPVAPRLIEDTYNVADAVVVGSLLITLLRHSDRVTAACQAQLVNAIAPIRTEPGGPSWRQTTFYPFAHAAAFARGSVLRVERSGPGYNNSKFGESAFVDAVATHDDDRGELTIFAINRSQTESIALDIGLRAFPGHRVVEHLVIADDDVRVANTGDRPDRVTPKQVAIAPQADSAAEVVLPAVSWNVIRLQRAPPSRSSWSAARGLKYFDYVPGGVLEQDLFAARADDDVVAECRPGIAESGDFGLDVVDKEVDAVPAAGFGFTSVGHRASCRTSRSR